jgi:hypothetical protein
MNKKKARKKKHEQLKKKAEILDSEIIGDEEEETLLGNLARVKEIPMIPLGGIPVFPTFEKTLPLQSSPLMEEMIKVFEETAANEAADLLGITPSVKPDIKYLVPGKIWNGSAGSGGGKSGIENRARASERHLPI